MPERPGAGPLGEALADLLLGAACVGCGRRGRSLCRACRLLLPCAPATRWPSPCPTGLAPPWSAAEYDGLVRELVTSHKERGVLSLAHPLGDLLAAAAAAALRGERSCVLVPVPSRASVVRSRGQDPLLRLVRVAAGGLRAGGTDARVQSLLRPHGRVRDQAGLSARERSTNVAGTMRARGVRSVVSSPVLLVDDVLTTGATAREAQRALEAVGTHPWAVVTVAATARRAPSGPRAVKASGLP